jgi:C4-dicarboxylate-specific signal transduction histidine kinase
MKADAELRDIPVLMISALDEIRSVVRCIEMGAEDYLPKPFDPVLLRARVGACLEKKRLSDEEHRKTEELEQMLQRLRQTQDQLIIRERLASLGAVSAGIAHEIKNPLNFVTNFSEVAMDLTREIREELHPDEIARIADILDNLDQSVSKVREHGMRADGIVRALLLHSRGQSAEKQRTDINALLASDANLAYHGLRAQDSTFNCTFRNDFDPSLEQVSAISEHLSRVFLNLINNACYAVHKKSRSSDSSYMPTISLARSSWASSKKIEAEQ